MSDDETAERVSVSKQVLGHPHNHHESVSTTPPAVEGEHFKVHASTIWGDYFVPTTVTWENGEYDRFTDLETSLENRRESKQLAEEQEA